MINIKDIVDLVNDLRDQNNGKYYTAEEITRVINISSLELFDELVGVTNKRIDNKTNVVYGKTQNTDFRLNPFRRKVTISVVDGEATLPTDCGKINTVLLSKDIPSALKRVDEDRFGMLTGNPLREPDEDDIYYTEGNSSLQILGAVDSIYLNYLKVPSDAKYAEKDITITVGDRTVVRKEYDPVASINLEWDKRETLDIVNRVLAKLAIPVRDGFLSQQVQINKINE